METVAIEQFVPTLRQLVNVALAPLLHSALLQAGKSFAEKVVLCVTREQSTGLVRTKWLRLWVALS